MTALSVQPPFPILTDIDGQPLEDGYIWIGVVNLAPITNPITVYWDAALTIPASQPIRTRGGYPMNSGTPARLYVGSDYSIQVQNRNGSVVYTSLDNNGPLGGGTISSVDVTFLQAGANAVERTAQSKMRETVSVKDFGAVGDGVADDTAAIQAALDSAKQVFFPAGTYYITSTVVLYRDNSIIGEGAENSTILYAAGITGVRVIEGAVATQFSINAATIEKICIRAAGSSAANIGLLLKAAVQGDPGLSAVANITLNSVSILGQQASLATPIGSWVGTGIVAQFALKCVFNDVIVTNCGLGVQYLEDPILLVNARSNSNWWNGCKIRANKIGMDIISDDTPIYGCVIESCSTGILLRGGKLTLSGNHFENTLGDQRQVHVLSGIVCSTGNFYSASGADLDIFFDTTTIASLSVSVNDTLNSGIKNTGLARVLVLQPTLALTTSGTGPICLQTNADIVETTNINNYNFTFNGHATYVFRRPIANTVGTLTIGAYAGDGVEFINSGGARVALLGTNGSFAPQNTTAKIYAGAGSPEGVLAANPGSIYLRTDGGAGTSFYVKEANISNTGWVAK
jgi:hypothetical protein